MNLKNLNVLDFGKIWRVKLHRMVKKRLTLAFIQGIWSLLRERGISVRIEEYTAVLYMNSYKTIPCI